jgi:hypothetical protein
MITHHSRAAVVPQERPNALASGFQSPNVERGRLFIEYISPATLMRGT